MSQLDCQPPQTNICIAELSAQFGQSGFPGGYCSALCANVMCPLGSSCIGHEFVGRIVELAERAAELGQRALALTDHDGLYGAIRFAEACDSLGYLSISALREAVGDQDRHEYCYACYTGDYPTDLVNIEELVAASVSSCVAASTTGGGATPAHPPT